MLLVFIVTVPFWTNILVRNYAWILLLRNDGVIDWGLRKLGIKKGDRVAIYMPMIVELPVAMLACARIGAAHSVIFGGFSPDSIVDRVNTTLQVWMGVTIACAQCHDHKYDPISQEEYFKVYAILNQTEDADRSDNSPLLTMISP